MAVRGGKDKAGWPFCPSGSQRERRRELGEGRPERRRPAAAGFQQRGSGRRREGETGERGGGAGKEEGNAGARGEKTGNGGVSGWRRGKGSGGRRWPAGTARVGEAGGGTAHREGDGGARGGRESGWVKAPAERRMLGGGARRNGAEQPEGMERWCARRPGGGPAAGGSGTTRRDQECGAAHTLRWGRPSKGRRELERVACLEERRLAGAVKRRRTSTHDGSTCGDAARQMWSRSGGAWPGSAEEGAEGEAHLGWPVMRVAALAGCAQGGPWWLGASRSGRGSR
ncbi:uncharacterized protein LOC133914799 [Phragmites australis]|uniref:uncharacterized protein LOC133914799 n=1 Tax=Phragmites australis TaxID=29695 RepID=UPI002D76E894|nr:uncharacterized protein LOC133914799 [Phragmites australis]